MALLDGVFSDSEEVKGLELVLIQGKISQSEDKNQFYDKVIRARELFLWRLFGNFYKVNPLGSTILEDGSVTNAIDLINTDPNYKDEDITLNFSPDGISVEPKRFKYGRIDDGLPIGEDGRLLPRMKTVEEYIRFSEVLSPLELVAKVRGAILKTRGIYSLIGQAIGVLPQLETSENLLQDITKLTGYSVYGQGV